MFSLCSRAQLPPISAHPLLSTLPICLCPQNLNHSVSLSPIKYQTINLLTPIVPICLVLQGSRWVCVFSSEPTVDSPKPVCRSPYSTQVAVMLCSVMLPHHKAIISTLNCLMPSAPGWYIRLYGMGWGASLILVIFYIHLYGG